MPRLPRSIHRLLLLSSVAFACNGPPAASRPVLATFPAGLNPDVPVGGESYECQLFDARPLQGAAVHGLEVDAAVGRAAAPSRDDVRDVGDRRARPVALRTDAAGRRGAAPRRAGRGEHHVRRRGLDCHSRLGAEPVRRDAPLPARRRIVERVGRLPGERGATRAPRRLGGRLRGRSVDASTHHGDGDRLLQVRRSGARRRRVAAHAPAGERTSRARLFARTAPARRC